MKEKIQKLVFPDEIIYEREKGQYRTEKVNSVFAWIAPTAKELDKKRKRGQALFG